MPPSDQPHSRLHGGTIAATAPASESIVSGTVRGLRPWPGRSTRCSRKLPQSASANAPISADTSASAACTGRRPTLFRPPYGEYDRTTLGLAESLGQRVSRFDALASGVIELESGRAVAHATPPEVSAALEDASSIRLVARDGAVRASFGAAGPSLTIPAVTGEVEVVLFPPASPELYERVTLTRAVALDGREIPTPPWMWGSWFDVPALAACVALAALAGRRRLARAVERGDGLLGLRRVLVDDDLPLRIRRPGVSRVRRRERQRDARHHDEPTTEPLHRSLLRDPPIAARVAGISKLLPRRASSPRPNARERRIARPHVACRASARIYDAPRLRVIARALGGDRVELVAAGIAVVVGAAREARREVLSLIHI